MKPICNVVPLSWWCWSGKEPGTVTPAHPARRSSQRQMTVGTNDNNALSCCVGASKHPHICKGLLCLKMYNHVFFWELHLHCLLICCVCFFVAWVAWVLCMDVVSVIQGTVALIWMKIQKVTCGSIVMGWLFACRAPDGANRESIYCEGNF